ncbi:MAG: hypothetical protein Q8L29_01525 [archaeon]|nr:hypothetical protein [archaeon]
MGNKGLTGKFNFIVPNIVSSFVEGEDAEALYDEVRKTIKSGVWYDSDSKTMTGSHTFLAARVDSIVRQLGKGIRVATLADLSRPEVMEMVKGRHYSDTPAMVLRTMEDSYEPNNALIRKLAPLVEQKNGRLQLPVLVTGFDVVPSEDKNGYGLDIVPREDFAVLHDKRFLDNEKNFSTVNENGLPNFDRKGNRTWYARSDGLSRLGLGGSLDLDSGCGDGYLAGSGEDGRVVLVRDLQVENKK